MKKIFLLSIFCIFLSVGIQPVEAKSFDDTRKNVPRVEKHLDSKKHSFHKNNSHRVHAKRHNYLPRYKVGHYHKKRACCNFLCLHNLFSAHIVL